MYDTAHPGRSTREEDISMDQDITETDDGPKFPWTEACKL